MITTHNLILGVDGGGTHTRIVAVDFEGNILATEKIGNLNYNSETISACRERLLEAIKKILLKVNRSGYDFLSVGISSLQKKATEAEKEIFFSDAFDKSKIYLQSDIYMALLTGASLGKPEVMIVSGTGAMGIAKDRDGHVFTRGGYGYLIDNDKGSSYYLAMNGIISVIDEYEGTGKKTVLTQSLMRSFNLSRVEDIVQIIYSPTYHISQGAAFTKDVIKAAKEKDEVAENIVHNCIDILVGYAVALANEINEEECGINVYGGLFQYNKYILDLFTDKLKKRLPRGRVKLPVFPAEIGAVIEYFLQHDLLTEDLLNNLGESMKRSGISAYSIPSVS